MKLFLLFLIGNQVRKNRGKVIYYFFIERDICKLHKIRPKRMVSVITVPDNYQLSGI
jgi:hypothetical protein